MLCNEIKICRRRRGASERAKKSLYELDGNGHYFRARGCDMEAAARQLHYDCMFDERLKPRRADAGEKT